MAKGNSNEAEELAAGPSLEVVEGESAEVQPEEITALLDEMARQNAEEVAAEDAAAAASAAASENAATAPGPQAEESAGADTVEAAAPAASAAPDGGAASEPVSESVAAVAPTEPDNAEAVAEGQSLDTPSNDAAEGSDTAVGPSFTMEDVMRAASESTSFTVDEIAQFETPPGEEPMEEGVPEPAESVAEEPESKDADGPREMTLEDTKVAPRASRFEEKAEQPKPEPKAKLAVLAPLAGIKSWTPWIVGPAAAAAVFLLVAGRLASVEGKVASRDKALKAAIADIAGSIDSLNERFGTIDRANVEKAIGGKKAGGNSAHVSSKSAKAHGEHGNKKHPEEGEASADGKHSAAGLNEGSHKPKASPETVSSHAAKAQKSSAHDGPEHFADDHYNSSAHVEGFKPLRNPATPKRFSSRLLAMGASRPGPKQKASHAAAPKQLDGGTIRVWLDGKLVPRR